MYGGNPPKSKNVYYSGNAAKKQRKDYTTEGNPLSRNRTGIYYDGKGGLMDLGSPKSKNQRMTIGSYKVLRSNTPSYKKGGKVKKTGLAKLHKGERVLNKKQTKKFDKKKTKKRKKYDMFNRARKMHFGLK